MAEQKNFYYQTKAKNEFVKKILDFEKKEETYVVVSLKPEFSKCSISLYDMTDFFIDKFSYEKSNEVEFNNAYQKAIGQLK